MIYTHCANTTDTERGTGRITPPIFRVREYYEDISENSIKLLRLELITENDEGLFRVIDHDCRTTMLLPLGQCGHFVSNEVAV